jgi:ABC-type transport system involved in multi-copper enzyme maturation permease subunit
MRAMRGIGLWLWRLVPGNPMLVRIVEGGSRRGQHMLARMGYLGLLVGLVIVGLLLGPGMAADVSLGRLAQAGSQTFRIIAYGQVIGVCLLAPLFMAGAIASEQSSKTYNILLTTPLSNLQIVLGSWLGRLFFVLALLLSGLPLFAVVLVFGGVRSGSVFTAFAVAACTAVFVGAVAVTLSVLRAGGRKAVFTFVIAIAAYLIGLYVLDRALLRVIDGRPYATWLTPLHPLLVLESSMLGDYRPPPPEELSGLPSVLSWLRGNPLGAFATWTLGGSVLLVLACAVGLRQVGQGQSKVLIRLAKWLRVNRGERAHAPRPVTGNPIAWREAKTRGRFFGGIVGRAGFAVLGWSGAAALVWAHHRGALPTLPSTTAGGGGVGGGSLPGAGAFPGAGGPQGFFITSLTMLVVIEVAIVCLVAIYMSAGCVSREREDGTLDIMLTTPVTPKQYVWGKLRGQVRFLGWMIAVPVVTLLGVGVYVLVGQFRGWPQATFTHYGASGSVVPGLPVLLPEAGLWLGVMLVPFVALCVAAGMGWSLKAKSVLGAVVPTVGIIGALTLVLGLCGYSGFGTTALVGPVINAFSPATGAWMLIDPWDRVQGFAEDTGFGRVSLGVAAALAAAGYGTIVYALLVGMVRSFDQTVRKLSGTG